MKLLPAYLVAMFLLVGCGKQEISGQVFIVTQGMGNIKLALVEVGAIPQEEFDQYLKAKQVLKLEQQGRLAPKYVPAKKELGDAFSKLSSPFTFEGPVFEMYSEVVKRTKDVIVEYEAFDNSQYILGTLPPAKFISKSDADGKFALSLPKGKYVVSAKSGRKIGDSSETYYWLVKIDESTPSNLMLSNDNLLESKCSECIKI